MTSKATPPVCGIILATSTLISVVAHASSVSPLEALCTQALCPVSPALILEYDTNSIIYVYNTLEHKFAAARLVDDVTMRQSIVEARSENSATTRTACAWFG